MTGFELEQKIAGLSAEIRNYPTPIARCDEQLTGLIEERSRLLALLEKKQNQGSCTPESLWVNDGGFNAA